jgi:hypothetical protein
MKLQFEVCGKLYRDCISLKLNPSCGNLKEVLDDFNIEFLKLAELFENLTSEYKYMNQILKNVRELDAEKVNGKNNVAA